MIKDVIESYFGSYERKSPARIEFVQKMEIEESNKGFPDWYIEKTLNAKKQPRFIEVRANNYPKLHEALTEECQFRAIDHPACYIDTESKNFPLAYARSDIETIFFTPETYEKMNKDELRAAIAHEVKHLYSGVAQSDKEKREIEKDCDRASIESTNYKTVQSYVDKAMAIMVDKKIPIPIFGQFLQRFNKIFPSAIAENCWIPLDSKHPSPAERMQEMRNHEKSINPTFTR